MRNIETTTISMPKAMARRVRRISRQENRTLSELFRQAFRVYENHKPKRQGMVKTVSGQYKKIDWEKMKKDLEEISKAGRKINLSKFIIRNRLSH